MMNFVLSLEIAGLFNIVNWPFLYEEVKRVGNFCKKFKIKKIEILKKLKQRKFKFKKFKLKKLKF